MAIVAVVEVQRRGGGGGTLRGGRLLLLRARPAEVARDLPDPAGRLRANPRGPGGCRQGVRAIRYITKIGNFLGNDCALSHRHTLPHTYVTQLTD